MKDCGTGSEFRRLKVQEVAHAQSLREKLEARSRVTPPVLFPVARVSRAGARTGLQLQGHGDMQGLNSPSLARFGTTNNDCRLNSRTRLILKHKPTRQTSQENFIHLPVWPNG